jgi:hypothetical protein
MSEHDGSNRGGRRQNNEGRGGRGPGGPGGPGRSSGPGRGRPAENKPSAEVQQAQIRKRAETLMRDAHIPENLAWQVARGSVTLNEVLQKMATRDKVDSLIRRYDLAKSLATQVALGQVELETVLRTRRMEDHTTKWRDHSILAKALAENKPLALSLHGKRFSAGEVLEVSKYEIRFRPRNEEETSVHKLHIKFACAAGDLTKVRAQVKKDPNRDAVVEPIERPQDRPGCSDKRFFSYIDEVAKIVITTIEGEVLRCTADWMGRWEVGVKLEKGAIPVTVFRHAIADIRKA